MLNNKNILLDGSGIYMFRNIINGKVYVGQSVSIKTRFREHRRKRNFLTNIPFYRAVAKYGWGNFDFSIIEVVDASKLDERESFWISFFNSHKPKFGYNICCVAGRTTRGRKRPQSELIGVTEFAKTRIGELNPFFGKKHSAETKAKISAANKGTLRTVEHISKLHKAAWSATSKRIIQICKETGNIICEWESCAAASRGTGISITGISQAATGRYKTAGGYQWRYV
jgi:group I intron endonuclease